MRVPDYDLPIRVRWYKVAEPTSYPETEYTSCRWDDEQNFDPPLGEQASMQRMHDDWADCSPPPWDDPPLNSCPLAAGPQWETYTLNISGLFSEDGLTALNGSWLLHHVSGCLWSTINPIPPFPGEAFWTLEFRSEHAAELVGKFPRFGLFGVVAYEDKPVDPYGPIRLPFAGIQSFDATYPDRVVLKGLSVGTKLIGEVFEYAGTIVPPRCLECNGQTVSREIYASLFGVIGDRFGEGDGVNTFNLPDYRDRVGVGQSPGGLVDRPSVRGVGDTFGEESHLQTVSEVGQHVHTGTFNGHVHGPGGTSTNFYTQAAAGPLQALPAGVGAAVRGQTSSTQGGLTTTIMPAAEPMNVCQPSIVLMKLIYTGV